MGQLTIFDDLTSAKLDVWDLTKGDFIELSTKAGVQQLRFHSIKNGDKRDFLVYDRKFVDGQWKEFNPRSSGFWGIELGEIVAISRY